MTNTSSTPHEDFKANGYMSSQISQGRAKSGYYYSNVSEDEGSVSIVVPNSKHLERADAAVVASTHLEFGDFDESKHPRGYHGRWALADSVPDAPGTAPIPEGHVRLYHYTQLSKDTEGQPMIERVHAAAQSLRDHGIVSSKALGSTYGEPNQIWASGTMPDPMTHVFAEIHVAPDDPRWDLNKPSEVSADSSYAHEWSNGKTYNQDLSKFRSDVTFHGDITPDDIVAVHEPWHEHARYFDDNPTMIQDAKNGMYDDLLDDPEYAPAILRAKADVGLTAAGPPDEPRDEKGQWTSGGGGDRLLSGLVDLHPDQPGLQLKAYHVTTATSAAAIEKNGWDVFRGGHQAFGSGIYANLDTPSGHAGQEKVLKIDDIAVHQQAGGKDLVQLELEVSVQNPFLADAKEYDRIYNESENDDDPLISMLGVSDEYQAKYDEMYEAADKNFEQYYEASDYSPTREGYAQWHAENTPDAPMSDVDPDYAGAPLESQIVRQLALDKGYDSIIWRDLGQEYPSTLGDQVVVLKSDSITVKGSQAVTASAVQRMSLVPLVEFLTSLKSSVTGAAHDVSDEPRDTSGKWTSGGPKTGKEYKLTYRPNLGSDKMTTVHARYKGIITRGDGPKARFIETRTPRHAENTTTEKELLLGPAQLHALEEPDDSHQARANDVVEKLGVGPVKVVIDPELTGLSKYDKTTKTISIRSDDADDERTLAHELAHHVREERGASQKSQVTHDARYEAVHQEVQSTMGIEYKPFTKSKFELTASANADHSDSAMIAWRPTDAEAKQLALPGGETPDRLHCTLLYLGKVADIEVDDARDITEAVANRFSPFVARIQGTAIFNTPDGDVLVRLVDAPELEQLQQRLHDEVAQIEKLSDNHGFTAHITLKYLAPDEEVDPAWFDFEPLDVVFGAIETDFGTERTSFPLATEIVLKQELAHDVSDEARSDDGRWTDGGGIDRVETLQKRAWNQRITSGEEQDLNKIRTQVIGALNDEGYDGKAVAEAMKDWSGANNIEEFRDAFHGYDGKYSDGVLQSLEYISNNKVEAPLYRGMFLDGDTLSEIKVGETIDHGVSSWSRSRDVAEMWSKDGDVGDIPVVLELSGGAHGMDIAALGERNYAWQQEVVVAEDRLRVTDIQHDGETTRIKVSV